MGDFLSNSAITIIITVLVSFVFALIKKGQFENWGKIAGKWLSAMGNLRLGKSKWEKMEDVITLSVLSFAKGLKQGADLDDALEEKKNGEEKNGETKS